MNQTTRLLINVASLNVGWFACVLGAARGYPLLGPVVVTALVSLHLLLSPNRKRELGLVLLVGALGTAIDSIQMAAGVLGFPSSAESAMIIPLWMTMLWINFATGLRVALRFLVGRPILAIALGFLGGGTAYFGGAKLGAISFPIGDWQGTVLVGLAWAILMPLMTNLAAGLHDRNVIQARGKIVIDGNRST